jgi:hypothetical protein
MGHVLWRIGLRRWMWHRYCDTQVNSLVTP